MSVEKCRLNVMLRGGEDAGVLAHALRGARRRLKEHDARIDDGPRSICYALRRHRRQRPDGARLTPDARWDFIAWFGPRTSGRKVR